MLLFNYRLKHFAKNLKTKWMDPLMVSNVYSNGKTKLEYNEKKKLMVNGQGLRHCHVGGFGVATVELL